MFGRHFYFKLKLNAIRCVVDKYGTLNWPTILYKESFIPKPYLSTYYKNDENINEITYLQLLYDKISCLCSLCKQLCLR